ncbi:MAG TPA: N-acetylglucosamine-6-phosphate deacetylase [Planctomycetales bacterium]|jgi:N-acetylglucosamine-6-phosphate deacetylase|nr:N-acetylglucosamine-6-phosphate deacetylase [Planctomycetales bacterium]
MRIRARWYATEAIQDFVGRDGRWLHADPDPAALPDLEAGWAAPGLFDLQINGCDGRSFNSPKLTTDAVRHVVQVCRRHGVAGLCPTLITESVEALLHGFTVLRQACESDAEIAHAVPALHLEGPYISPEDGPRGAHPRRHVRRPDWDEFRRFQEASGGRIRLVTLAPEQDGALAFIEKLTASGVVVALGHTAADGARIRDAVRAGARLSTHLGNGCHALLPRHDNPIWEQLAADELWASVICDGWHLTPAVARCILRVKTPARAVLTCDASSLAGLPPGRYEEWGDSFEVLADGKVVVPGTSYLAGSGVFTDTCVGWAIRHAGVGLRDAIDMASARPRELLGLPDELTDLMLFEYEPGGEVRVTATMSAS